ncbi:hypothetical protein CJF32_00001287 [Rutstroemia sp. NJR-2017a WRK4]|nr:hypothetical protein CJF32_00001287 [Rutstroemia sp. NJR-2017a WRK4]
MSSESIPTATTSAEAGDAQPAEAKPKQAQSDRAKLESSTPSTPDSMKVKFGSEAATESEAARSERSSNEGSQERPEEAGSDGSWEEIKRESGDGEAHGDDKNERVGDESSNGVPPDFRPRTPRPYGS